MFVPVMTRTNISSIQEVKGLSPYTLVSYLRKHNTIIAVYVILPPVDILFITQRKRFTIKLTDNGSQLVVNSLSYQLTVFIICSQRGTTILVTTILVSVCTCLYPRFEKYRQKVQTYQILTEEGLSETLTSTAWVYHLLSLALNNTHTQDLS